MKTKRGHGLMLDVKLNEFVELIVGDVVIKCTLTNIKTSRVKFLIDAPKDLVKINRSSWKGCPSGP